MNLLRGVCLAAGLFASWLAAAQEPETYFPYEAEPVERIPMLLTDSVLFYRAVQTAADLFGAATDYDLSFVRSKRRGLDYGSELAAANGAEVSWRYLAALRALGAEERIAGGLQTTDGLLGGANGIRSFRIGDAEPLPAGRVAAGFTDRNYLAAAKGAYAGSWGRGWDYAAAADARTGRDMRVEGVFTNALTASLRATRRLGEGHRLSLLAVVPLSQRGLRSASTDEAFTLTGDRLYNPAWGLQDGKVRNAHIRRDFLPFALVSYAVPLTAATELETTLGAVAGVSKYSTLGWYDARTPVPDNYRYLPSYTGDRETEEAWRASDPHYTQIDWDELYAQNRMKGGEAVYALEDRVERVCDLRFAVAFATRADERLTVRYGAAAHYASSRKYKQMRDLLGAGYLTDIDQYLVDDDTYGNFLQNDLRHPNRRIAAGDRFGYDYALTSLDAGIRVQAQYRADRFRFDAGAEIRDASVRRRGYLEKELYAGPRSYGRSAAVRFTPYLYKASAGWSFSPKSYLGASVMAAAVPPDADALFLQPQYNNRTADRPVLRKLWSGEVVFNYTDRMFDLRAAAYVNFSRGGMETYRYYDDLAGLFCDLTASGIGMRAYGIEAAAAVRLSYRWRLSLAAAAGRYEYDRDPRLTILADADNAPVELGSVAHMGGCRTGNAPQLSGLAEIAYFGAKGWGFRCTAAYAGARYAEPAFLRRTERVARQAAATPEAFDRFTEKERLAEAFTLGASAFKTFYLGESRLTVSLMLRNLLNSRDQVYAAYESLRVRRMRSGDTYAYAPFETRRTYAYPRSFYLSVSYRF